MPRRSVELNPPRCRLLCGLVWLVPALACCSVAGLLPEKCYGTSMTNGVVFILHSVPNAAFAADLADALAPLVALPMAFTPDSTARRQAAFGSGAVCVVLLDQVMAGQNEAIVRSAPSTTSVICRERGVALPLAFAAYSSVQVLATIEPTASALRDAITNKQIEAAERNVSRRPTHAPAMRSTPARDTGKNSMLTRSAWGFAATVLVAGIAAPVIDGRAGASSVPAEADLTDGASQASDVMTVAEPVRIAAVAPRHFEPVPLTGLLEHVDASAPGATDLAPASSAVQSVAPELLTVSLIPPVEAQIEIKPDTMIAIVVDAGAPKGGAAPQGSDNAEKERVAREAFKPRA